MSGHTHGSVDQLFSRFADHMNKNSKFDPDEMEEMFRTKWHLDGDENNENFVAWQGLIPAISRWAAQFCEISKPTLYGIMSYRSFRIKKNDDGYVEICAKRELRDGLFQQF